MDGVDLGKQVGPLPMGAWIVVVGTGLGIAYYARKKSQETPTVVTDTSGTPGVGTGDVGGFSQTSPGDQGLQTPTIQTNEDWAKAAINWLIAQGYDANVSDSAIRKYLAVETQSVQEYTLTGLALQHLGSPPQPLPPGGGSTPTPTPIPTGGGTSTAVPAAVTNLRSTGAIVAGPSNAVIYVAWNTVNGATSYVAQIESPYDNADVVARSKRETVTPQTTFYNLQALDTNHRITVWAKNGAGLGPPASITVHAPGHFVGPRPAIVNQGI